MASNAAVPNSFTNGVATDAPSVNANFAALVSWINTNAVHLDGAKAFTAVPTGPATDPTSANHLSRKQYVDTIYNNALAYTDSKFPVVNANIGAASVSADKLATSLARNFTVADTTALAALTGLRAGDMAFVVADGLLRWYTGTAWKFLHPQRGSVTLTFTSSITSNTPTVTFPVAFASTPVVSLTAIAFTGNTPIAVDLVSVTASNFTLIGRNVQANASGTIPLNGSLTVYWTAYEG